MNTCNKDHIPISWETNISCPACHERDRKVGIDVRVSDNNLRLTMEKCGNFGAYVHVVLYNMREDQFVTESYIKVLDLFEKK